MASSIELSGSCSPDLFGVSDIPDEHVIDSLSSSQVNFLLRLVNLDHKDEPAVLQLLYARMILGNYSKVGTDEMKQWDDTFRKVVIPPFRKKWADSVQDRFKEDFRALMKDAHEVA